MTGKSLASWFNLLCFVIGLLLPTGFPAQELDPKLLSPAMRARTSIPDDVIYGTFLRHAATFEKLAIASEARGLSGTPYRNAIMNKFGLTVAEEARVTNIATTYQSEAKVLQQRLRAEYQNFRAQNFPNNQHRQGTSKPLKSAAIVMVAEELRQATFQARDEMRTTLGDTRFAQVDSQIRAHAEHDFTKIQRVGN